MRRTRVHTVRAWCSAAMVTATVVMLALSLPSRASASASTPARSCPGIKLSVTMPKPATGYIARGSIKVEDDCSLSTTPIQIVPASDATPNRRISAAPLWSTGLNTVSGGTTSPPPPVRMQTESAVWDCCGIELTELHSNNAWNGDGSIVTGYVISGSVYGHSESTPAGPGWTLTTGSNALYGGCAGCNVAQFHQHAEYAYKGVFDPTGNLYYNILDSYESNFGNGTWQCTLDWSARNTFPGWTWNHTCG